MSLTTLAILKGIVVAFIIGVVIYGYNMFVNHHQKLGYDKRTSEYVEQENKDLKAAIAETERLKQLVEEATNERKKIEDKNTILVTRNNSLLSKLRDHDTNINQPMSTASYDALQFAAKTYRELFAECRTAYAEMGRAATGHLEDVKQLETAWPIKESQ